MINIFNSFKEYTQIVMRLIPIYVSSCILYATLSQIYYKDNAFGEDPIIGFYIFMYFFYFMIEFQYYVMHSRRKEWENPFYPAEDKNVVFPAIRNIYYSILRLLIYVQYIFYFAVYFIWIFACVYQYQYFPKFWDIYSTCIGLLLFPILSYIGISLVKKRYFKCAKVEKSVVEN